MLPKQRSSSAAPTGPAWWRQICAGYLGSLARKNRRPNTLITYGYGLAACGSWLDHESVDDADQLTGAHLERWQDFSAPTLKPRSQQVYAAALRGALKWATLQQPPLAAPTLWLQITTPQAGRLIPKPIPQADLTRLLLALAPVPDPAAVGRLRARALFLTILSSGVRINEALQLDRDQIEDRTATVIQKGGGEKLLVISLAAEVAIADYLAVRTDSCKALFVSKREQRIDAWTVQIGWDLLCTQIGIKHFSSHQIRHSCATELLRQKVDSIIIAKHLGHRGLAYIQGYAEVGLDARHEMLEVLDDRIRRAS